MQASFYALGAAVAELQGLYHSGGPAPAPAPTSAAAVDPMAEGRGSWSTFLGKGPAAPAFASAAPGGRPQLVLIHTPMKAIEDAGARQRPAVMMVQVVPPRPQGGQLADHIRATPAASRQNGNCFQPLTMEKVSFWEAVARASAPPSAHQPSLVEADCPPLS